MDVAPRTAFPQSFDHLNEIYYTTDDGFAELRPRMEPRHDAEHVAGLYEIFARYEEFHRRVGPGRRNRIHLASVVGGLDGLNLIPIFRPRELMFFDLTFRFPRNAVLFASYFDKTEMLDLGTAGSTPVTVYCRTPMAIER